MNKIGPLFVAGLIAAASHAQITALDTIADGIRPVYTLQDAGLKYMPARVQEQSNLNIYNQDLTVYRVLTVPPPPPGFTYNTLNYVTEDLFDTDPSNIEYMVYASAGFTFYTYVYREDGTLLLIADGLPNGGMAQYLIGGYDPIVPTDQGPMLHISPMPLATEVRRYLLPGELPCLGCAGVAGYTGMVGQTEVTDAMPPLVYPNPAEEQVTIRYALPEGERSGVLVLFDDQGRSVLTRPTDGTGQVRIATSLLANGAYHWRVITRNAVLPGSTLVVAH